ncbi:MAG: hypothetical protein Phyf2KO_27160 [Phycisphaerales bacterium]
MPKPGSPEADRLDLYLAKYQADCPGCGYKLHGLQNSVCPECGRGLSVAELIVPPAVDTANDFANTMTALSLLLLAFILVLSLLSIGASRSFTEAVAGLVAGILVFGFIVFFAVTGRRLMKENKSWAILFNPVGAIIMLASTGCIFSRLVEYVINL